MGIINKFKSALTSFKRKRKEKKSKNDDNKFDIGKSNTNSFPKPETENKYFSMGKRRKTIIHDFNKREELYREINNKLNKINSK